MKKYAVALTKGENEVILALFRTKEEADMWGSANRIPHAAGLQYCFCSGFSGKKPIGKKTVYDFYNVG